MNKPFPQIHLPEGSYDLMPVAELKTKFHPDNNNLHPASQLSLYGEVLSAGIRRAAVLSALSGRLVVGHGAVLAADAMGWESFPVQVQSFESEAEEMAFLLADNELPKLSKRADPKTAAILSRLREKQGFNLSATGMKEKAIQRLLQKNAGAVGKPSSDKGRSQGPLEKQREALEKWGVESGQLWRCGRHRVLCASSNVPESFLRLDMPEKFLLFADPVYCSGGFQESGKNAGSWGSLDSDNLSTDGFRALLRDVLAAAPGALAVYLFTDWRMCGHVREIVEGSGAPVRAQIVWNKGAESLGELWRSQHELIIFGQRVSSKRDAGESGMGNVIDCPRCPNEWHQTQKPVPLLKAVLENDAICKARGKCAVYDPFCGSGSGLLAAAECGRAWYGVDKSPGAVAATLERWTLAGGEKPRLVL